MNLEPHSAEPNRVEALAAALAGHLDPGEVEEALGRLQSADETVRETIVGLGLLLIERSTKATAEYLRQAPLLVGRLERNEWGPWVGTGMTIAVRSAVAAVRYFRESPAVLAEIDPAVLRLALLSCANRLAERDAGLALELVRQAPAVIRLLPDLLPDDDPDHAPDRTMTHRLALLHRWVSAVEQLAQQDAVLASEYVKHSAEVLVPLPVSALADWAELGGTLVQPNRLGKPDYLPALEFFRLSPEWLVGLTPPESRVRLLRLVRLLTDESPDRRVQLLRETPAGLQAIASAEQRHWLLGQVEELMVISPDAAVALLERGAEVLRRYALRAPQQTNMPGYRGTVEEERQDWRVHLAEWVRQGTALLVKSREAGVAYFRLESAAAEQWLDQVAGGLSLRSVARILQLFAEGLSGQAVTVAPMASAQLPDAVPYRQGQTIFLPPFVSGFGSGEENFRYYRVMTAHQAVQLEFHSFQIAGDELVAIARTMEDDRPLRISGEAPEPETVEEFFASRAYPLVAQDLWKIAEGGRIDARLRESYPGLRRDLELVVGYALYQRPSMPPPGSLEAGPSLVERVMEWLLQLSMAGRTKEPIPTAQQPFIDELCRLLFPAQRPGATAADSLRAACRSYERLVQSVTHEMDHRPAVPSPPMAAGANPLAIAGKTVAASALERYQELIAPHYRGRQGAAQAGAGTGPLSQQAGQPRDAAVAGGVGRGSDGDSLAAPDDGGSTAGSTDSAADSGDVEQPEAAPAQSHRSLDGAKPPGLFHYPEWDQAAQDYRPAWCAVREQRLHQAEPPDASPFVETMRARYHGQLLLLRQIFERLRPDRFRKLKRQEQGDEIDLEAAIEAAVDRRAGRAPSAKLYEQRDRRERSVAVALLVDVSGSTGKLLGAGRGARQDAERANNRTVVQVEKESLFLLAEAVGAVGDALAIYAYSGEGRERVDFFVIKEFDEPYNQRIGERIGAMRALAQNRDGAAIRHAAAKLLRQDATTRLLLLLSDSRPFDRDYEGAYALADTRQALLEAHQHRIRTFCITIDHRADDYLGGLFTPGRYAVIDDVSRLPERLPRIYQRITAST